MDTIESLNKLRDTLELERAYVLISTWDYQNYKKYYSMADIKYEYSKDFVELLMKATFTKTYNNTLSATIEYKNLKCQVDLFVDC